MNGVGLSAHSRLYCVILVQSTFSETLLVYAYIGTKVFDFCQLVPYCDSGLLISMSILSTILLMYRYRYRRYFRIKVSIAVSTILCWPFLSTLHRYFSTDVQNDAHNYLSFRAFVRVQRSVEILDERRITCNKI